MVAYIVDMFIIWDNRPWIQAIGGRRVCVGGGGKYSDISINPDISQVWSMDSEDHVITGFYCINCPIFFIPLDTILIPPPHIVERGTIFSQSIWTGKNN